MSGASDAERAQVDYVHQLSDRERRILEVARSHLGGSFDLSKSIGYQTYLESRPSYGAELVEPGEGGSDEVGESSPS